jgi:hypothetical protein
VLRRQERQPSGVNVVKLFSFTDAAVQINKGVCFSQFWGTVYYFLARVMPYTKGRWVIRPSIFRLARKKTWWGQTLAYFSTMSVADKKESLKHWRQDACVISKDYSKQDTYYIFNHVDITIAYHSGVKEDWGKFLMDAGETGGRIVCESIRLFVKLNLRQPWWLWRRQK